MIRQGMQTRNPEIDSSKVNSYLEIVYMHIHGENTPMRNMNYH